MLMFIGLGPASAAVPNAPWDDPAEQTVGPDGFTLSAAYPNPFNPTTSFTLSVEQTQNVQIEVFNLLGVPVQQLFNGVMQAGETHSFTFTADGLPSGIYLYRAQGETFTATRQMTLLK